MAVSCLEETDSEDALPPLTAYYVMRVGKLPMAPCFPPGDESLADAVAALSNRRRAVLLANHGPVVADADLDQAAHSIEELEETAKLHLLLKGKSIRPLTPEQVAALRERFPN